MIAQYFTPSAPTQMPLGKCADGREVFVPFLPSVVHLAYLPTPHRDGKAGAEDIPPLPVGMHLFKSEVNQQMQLVVSDTYSRRVRNGHSACRPNFHSFDSGWGGLMATRAK